MCLVSFILCFSGHIFLISIQVTEKEKKKGNRETFFFLVEVTLRFFSKKVTVRFKVRHSLKKKKSATYNIIMYTFGYLDEQ